MDRCKDGSSQGSKDPSIYGSDDCQFKKCIANQRIRLIVCQPIKDYRLGLLFYWQIKIIKWPFAAFGHNSLWAKATAFLRSQRSYHGRRPPYFVVGKGHNTEKVTMARKGRDWLPRIRRRSTMATRDAMSMSAWHPLSYAILSSLKYNILIQILYFI